MTTRLHHDAERALWLAVGFVCGAVVVGWIAVLLWSVQVEMAGMR